MQMDWCDSCAYRKHKDKLVSCCCSQLAYAWRELWRQLLPVFKISPYRCNHWEPAMPPGDPSIINCRCTVHPVYSGELLKPRPVTLCKDCGKWYERGGHVKDGARIRFGICIKDYEFTSENNGCCDGSGKESNAYESKTREGAPADSQDGL